MRLLRLIFCSRNHKPKANAGLHRPQEGNFLQCPFQRWPQKIKYKQMPSTTEENRPQNKLTTIAVLNQELNSRAGLRLFKVLAQQDLIIVMEEFLL